MDIMDFLVFLCACIFALFVYSFCNTHCNTHNQYGEVVWHCENGKIVKVYKDVDVILNTGSVGYRRKEGPTVMFPKSMEIRYYQNQNVGGLITCE